MISLGFPAVGPLVSAAWLALVLLGWGWILGRLIQIGIVPREPGVVDPSRRQFLYLVGVGSFTILVTSVGVSLVSSNQSIPGTGQQPGAKPTGPEGLANASTTSGPAQSPSTAALAARFPAITGTRSELTSNLDFYRVDINTVSPRVDGTSWRLDLVGLVDRPLHLTLDEIRSRPSQSQAITQECISNQLGGDLISSALWTGVRLKDLLAEAGVKPGAMEISIQAADGFYESLPMSEAMDDRTLLVYEMNGETLPVDHGFPLRIYIPNHYGMKQPKWITRMEVVDHDVVGYWVERGWSKDAIPQTTSVIDTVAINDFNSQTGILPVGGIAYAGARGVSKVEIQVDNGAWETAELRSPPLSPLTWVEWRYQWKAIQGTHTFRVRATDGAGKVQTADVADTFPDGATGLDYRTDIIPEGVRR
jgi:DMSO/TMAO reductase YedYZ molybdopterin-dependent catalytic subunit